MGTESVNSQMVVAMKAAGHTEGSKAGAFGPLRRMTSLAKSSMSAGCGRMNSMDMEG